MPKNPYEVIRRYPWDSLPKYKQVKRRWSREYYQLTLYLRKYPPNETPFRIKDLMKLWNADYPSVYGAIRSYFFDSKLFLAKIYIPEDIVKDDKTWVWAIEQLHKDGFYMIQCRSYHSALWEEPSFRQFEDYDSKYLHEAFNRALTRLQDGAIFGLTFDGLDIRKELDYLKRRQKMLEDKTEDEE